MISTEGLIIGRIPMLTALGKDDESNGERLAGCRDGAQHYAGGDFQSDLGDNGHGLNRYLCGSCGGIYLVNVVNIQSGR